MKVLVAIVASVIAVIPAGAQDRPKKTLDPNRMICRSSEVIGSRLQTERKCMTKQEWTRLEREQRETVEKVQFQRY